MNHAKTSLSTEIFAGEIISVVQYMPPLQYPIQCRQHQQKKFIQDAEKAGQGVKSILL
jgi:hypothetical protein